ncbi:hypothetical protein DFJ73DRAFT_763744 [Zopfochytrium polystomum]|nr:hypothetical protein DFJ73DRAFT_763744 [Zopfochytrium polystomum]
MKSFLPIAVAFLLAVVAANAAPARIHVQAIDEFDSYNDHKHATGANSAYAQAQRRQTFLHDAKWQDAYKKERAEEKKQEAKEKAERKAAKEAAKAKGQSSGKKGKNQTWCPPLWVEGGVQRCLGHLQAQEIGELDGGRQTDRW